MTQPSVWLYSLSTCSICRELKKELEKKKVKYQTIDVDRLGKDEQGEILEILKEYNPKLSFPTLVVGDEVVVGYQKENVAKALKRLEKEKGSGIGAFLRRFKK